MNVAKLRRLELHWKVQRQGGEVVGTNNKPIYLVRVEHRRYANVESFDSTCKVFVVGGGGEMCVDGFICADSKGVLKKRNVK